MRSPDEAKRNPGLLLSAVRVVPDFAALHAGYKIGAQCEPYFVGWVERSDTHQLAAA